MNPRAKSLEKLSSRIRVKRVYDPVEPEDGLRILVDGVWPRGLTRETVAAACWLKELAPSPELRRWFRHDPEKWAEFRARYRRELQQKEECVRRVLGEVQRQPVTLLYSSRDELHNQAMALREYLMERLCKLEAATGKPRGRGGI